MTKETQQQTAKRIKDKFVTINDFNEIEVRIWIDDLIARGVIAVSIKKNYLEISDTNFNLILNGKDLPDVKIKKVKQKGLIVRYLKRDSLKRKIELDKEYRLRYCYLGQVFIHYANFEKNNIENQIIEFITPLLIPEVKDREIIIVEI